MEDKRVTHTARAILRIWNTGWFAFVWTAYYNKFMFDNYRILGALFSVLTFFIIYSALCSVYKAFRIASTDVGEIVFSQFVSFGAADLFLYIECVLVYNQLRNIIPGAVIVVIQLLGTMFITLTTKRYFMRHVAPQKTLLVYGGQMSREEVMNFEKRLLYKYRHLFDIQYTEHENISQDTFLQRLNAVETVIMYNISPEKRHVYTYPCLELKKNFYYTPNIQDILEFGCEPKHLLDTPIMKYEYRYEGKRKLLIKRCMDILFSVFFLTLLSPLMLIIAICIKAEDGGPVFFCQERYTKDAKVFKMIKFRSMIVDAEKQGVTPSTSNDARITKTGQIIRKFRLDEIPQFINILKGEMSFVGPRPERVEHVDMYMLKLPEFRYRLSVKGGLTGYAQVYGKYNTSAYDKLMLDLMYIENQSVLLDFKIALLTLRTIFQKESTEGFSEEVSAEINKDTRKEG